ncbi:SixA phosphatase family protein [Methylotuvimicrobium alcaliphilum]|uniref:Phosphohistidine phosphatase, SixA n=1 Tax=Methylotuvimicrobium alcaliphilum (strain DSM 19304 / NCIMB 14124 / VKM B-2133 / 20Z) TaxID=1091494 RepID=G4SWB1_META2
MAKTLMLLRHGKSDWEVDADDFNRPLKKRGKKAAVRIGQWMRKQKLKPGLIVTSPAVRAQTTAERASEALGFAGAEIIRDQRLYEAELADFKAVLSDCPADIGRILLVGHNPGLETLLHYLVAGIEMPDDGKLLATATLAVLTMPSDWTELNEHCAKLVSITRASSLS